MKSFLAVIPLLAFTSLHAAVDESVKAFTAVGREGRGNEAASAAWKKVVEAGPAVLPAMSSSGRDDGVIYSPSNGITALAPRPNGTAPGQLWRAKQINPATISPLILGDRLFSINSAGVRADSALWRLGE